MVKPLRNNPRSLKELLLSVFSGMLAAASFPGTNLQWLAWFAFIPLFIALRKTSRSRAFYLSCICGLVFWSGTINWLIHVTLPGTAVLALYLSLYFGLFGLLICSSVTSLSLPRVFFIPSVWVALEYLRSYLFTGFPWALLGYSQSRNLPAIQIADITGTWGVSFLVMMVNAALYALVDKDRRIVIKRAAVPGLIAACIFGYGYFKLGAKAEAPKEKSVKICVVQGNIPQELKWYPEARGPIVAKYSAFSRICAKESPNLIVWPEAALPVIVEEEPEYYQKIADLAKALRIPILMGAVTSREGFYYNSALMLSEEGELLTRYDKLHLVPFGEYIPLKKTLPFLETVVPIGDVTPGREYTIFQLGLAGPGHGIVSRFATLICFEDVFPELSREFVRKGAQYLINITNDAWYQKTGAAYQHFQASVFRAVENRVWVLRSANTGVSGFISPQGRAVSLVKDDTGSEIFVDGHRTLAIPAKKDKGSFYTRYGDWFVWLCFIMILVPFISKKEGTCSIS